MVGGAEDAGGFGHEMHAAEDYVIGFGPGRRFLGKQERVTLKVGILDDFFSLVVMAQDGNRFAQPASYVANPLVQFICAQMQVFVGDALPLDVDGKLLRQGLGGQFILGFTKSRVFQFSDRDSCGTASGIHSITLSFRNSAPA